ncbi:hypothetical protein NEF87_004903 [Candidatus Lokiarchaeum ossiferum]|uniref:Uncharacterized protein n=1 Tax=Candidatus Lokiarchaeum ossiferum TaxID=2951803 RepID=A0ABY6HYZ1_9ARCH|nr:hypothetical protein NEF87_004903 [Candidatus Lokiarchaeum sp. B-35]
MTSSKEKFNLGDYGCVKEKAWQHFVQGNISEYQWENISLLCDEQLSLVKMCQKDKDQSGILKSAESDPSKQQH